MRKDIKKRLEKALITLQEPGGSTIRSIIKVINHDSPVLSLRKVLEALQEGINEGFLCMYNGRFKLKQQLFPTKGDGIYEDSDLIKREKKKSSTPDSQMPEEDSDVEFEEEDEDEDEDVDVNDDDDDDDDDRNDSKILFKIDHAATLDEQASEELTDKPPRKKNKKRNTGSGKKKDKKRRGRSFVPKRRSSGKGIRKARKQPLDTNIDCLRLMKSSSSIPETKPGKPIVDRPDMKKQRGPRCTSMKKDVRMPSKVHIPFVTPSMPQKGANFNDLVRRSPDPVNGPLFDDYVLRSPGLEMFDTFC